MTRSNAFIRSCALMALGALACSSTSRGVHVGPGDAGSAAGSSHAAAGGVGGASGASTGGVGGISDASTGGGAGASAGRSENVWTRSMIVGYRVTRSRSANVNTVSRCIAARSFGMPATITRSAASAANRAEATCVIACRDVRSLIPISTTPLPTGMMSPPSNVARPQSSSGSPHQIVEPV